MNSVIVKQETRKLTGSYMPIDFAAHARSLGAKAYKATNPEELKAALLQAKKETVTTLSKFLSYLVRTQAAMSPGGRWAYPRFPRARK